MAKRLADDGLASFMIRGVSVARHVVLSTRKINLKLPSSLFLKYSVLLTSLFLKYSLLLNQCRLAFKTVGFELF